MFLPLYTTALRAATPLVERYLRARVRRGKEDPARAGERRGRASLPRPAGTLIWFHAASVGESLSLLSVIGRILSARPAAHVLVTTGTVTSARLMAARLPDRAFHQYVPVDHPAWVAAFVDHWRPDLAIWTESEFWPALLGAVRRRGIPALLLNARMSGRSYRRWRHMTGPIRDMLSTFSLCLAQGDDDAAHLQALGARGLRVLPNLKYAADPLPADAAKLAALRGAIAGRPVVLFASTHPGEEDVAARLHAGLSSSYPGLLTIIVPRHPARGVDLAARLRAIRRAGGDAPVLPGAEDQIYIADTMGELGIFYRLVPFAVIGGSFVPQGGHNPIEPGQLHCAPVYGPHTHNFIQICKDFESRDAAVSVADETALQAAVREFLDDPARAAAVGAAAQKWTQDSARVSDQIMTAMSPWLEPLR